MPTYRSRNPLAAASPLRSLPFMRPAAEVLGTSWYDGTWNQPKPKPAAAAPEPVPAPAAPIDPATALRHAEIRLRDAERVYAFARREIGEANRRVLPSLTPAFIREQVERAGGSVPTSLLTPERVRERKSYAFRLFNQRRGELSRARKAVDAARDALDLPLLAAVQAREAARQEIRAGKRQAAPMGVWAAL